MLRTAMRSLFLTPKRSYQLKLPKVSCVPMSKEKTAFRFCDGTPESNSGKAMLTVYLKLRILIPHHPYQNMVIWEVGRSLILYHVCRQTHHLIIMRLMSNLLTLPTCCIPWKQTRLSKHSKIMPKRRWFHMSRSTLDSAERFDVIWDHYLSDSLKATTRESWIATATTQRWKWKNSQELEQLFEEWNQ